MTLLDRLGLRLPIVQAPMAGTATPALAAAVSNAGGLGSLGLAATDARGAREMIESLRAQTDRAFNVNVFVHATPQPDPARETAWLAEMAPLFARFGTTPPSGLRTIYRSFLDDDDMLRLLVAEAPPVVSFHFGVPDAARIAALKQAGCTLFATATSLAEARAIEAAGIDAIVAQGYEAGGHRGVFDDDAPDDQLGAMALTRLLAARRRIPVIAAGGIMDGQGVRAALDLGAIAAQLGTAFVACPESNADAAYRAALQGSGAEHTVMTPAISGRRARCLGNRFTEWAATARAQTPAYPIAYDAGKALIAAAKAAGETGFGAQWAGQGAPLSRPLPAAELVALLAEEAGLAG
jgi:nitronate monooxygenase